MYCRAISPQRRFSQNCDDPRLRWIFSSPLSSLTLSVLILINWRSGAQNLIRGIYHVDLKVMMRRALRWLKPEGLMFVQVHIRGGCLKNDKLDVLLSILKGRNYPSCREVWENTIILWELLPCPCLTFRLTSSFCLPVNTC